MVKDLTPISFGIVFTPAFPGSRTPTEEMKAMYHCRSKRIAVKV